MERGDSTTDLKKRKHFSQGIKQGFIIPWIGFDSVTSTCDVSYM